MQPLSEGPPGRRAYRIFTFPQPVSHWRQTKMKKQALAAATLSALTLGGVAHAQSSVTLYGVADMALAKVSGQSLTLAGASPLTNGSSRIGFRGTEDMGGGMKASFNLEAQIDPTSGATQTALFSRAANLTLSG